MAHRHRPRVPRAQRAERHPPAAPRGTGPADSAPGRRHRAPQEGACQASGPSAGGGRARHRASAPWWAQCSRPRAPLRGCGRCARACVCARARVEPPESLQKAGQAEHDAGSWLARTARSRARRTGERAGGAHNLLACPADRTAPTTATPSRISECSAARPAGNKQQPSRGASSWICCSRSAMNRCRAMGASFRAMPSSISSRRQGSAIPTTAAPRAAVATHAAATTVIDRTSHRNRELRTFSTHASPTCYNYGPTSDYTGPVKAFPPLPFHMDRA